MRGLGELIAGAILMVVIGAGATTLAALVGGGGLMLAIYIGTLAVLVWAFQQR